MCCNDYRCSLHEYANGQLNELERHAIAKHLKTCDKCRRELEEIKGLKAFIRSDLGMEMLPPLDLKADIMASINLKRYKKVYKNTWGELANWGMSLVAAGLILLFVNVAPANDIKLAQTEWVNTKTNISEKIQQPFSTINKGLGDFTRKISELDGISGRIEREKKGVD